MTGQEKHTRLTLDEMIRRSEQVKEAKSKNKTKELYVESLGGTITITKPTRNQVNDAMNMDAYSGESDAYLVYECVTEPPLKNKQLQQAYGCQDPLDILDKIFEPGEVVNISKAALSFAGFELIHYYVQRGFDWDRIAGATGNEKAFLRASMIKAYEEEAEKIKAITGGG